MMILDQSLPGVSSFNVMKKDGSDLNAILTHARCLQKLSTSTCCLCKTANNSMSSQTLLVGPLFHSFIIGIVLGQLDPLFSIPLTQIPEGERGGKHRNKSKNLRSTVGFLLKNPAIVKSSTWCPFTDQHTCVCAPHKNNLLVRNTREVDKYRKLIEDVTTRELSLLLWRKSSCVPWLCRPARRFKDFFLVVWLWIYQDPVIPRFIYLDGLCSLSGRKPNGKNLKRKIK